MITILLAESELEKIPKKILLHPAVKSQAKHRNKNAAQLILDSSYHHSAMKSINEGRRRGRPDIVHIFLLSVLESIANKNGFVKEIIVHTRNDEVIFINPATRIMRNYTRFIGLIEQLYEKEKIIAEGKILLELKKGNTLESLIKNTKSEYSICLTDKGRKVFLSDYFKKLKKGLRKEFLIIIGGFPSGNFHNDITSLTDEQLSIFNERLTAWTVANELLVNYQNEFGK